jgi:hypothetical protein
MGKQFEGKDGVGSGMLREGWGKGDGVEGSGKGWGVGGWDREFINKFIINGLLNFLPMIRRCTLWLAISGRVSSIWRTLTEHPILHRSKQQS